MFSMDGGHFGIPFRSLFRPCVVCFQAPETLEPFDAPHLLYLLGFPWIDQSPRMKHGSPSRARPCGNSTPWPLGVCKTWLGGGKDSGSYQLCSWSPCSSIFYEKRSTEIQQFREERHLMFSGMVGCKEVKKGSTDLRRFRAVGDVLS